MKRFTLLIFVIIATLPQLSRAQDFVRINGIVVDSLLNEPVAGAIVTVLPEGRSAITASDGTFAIDRILPGRLTIKVESAFHRVCDRMIAVAREGDQIRADIRLLPLTMTSSEVVVEAERFHPAGIRSYSVTEQNRSSRESLGSYLDRRGYYLESDGRNQYVALRGFTPQSVLVLMDGVAMNPDGGSVDLSTVSLATVDRIDVYTSGAASRFGANALGGAINVISRNSNMTKPSLSAGSQFGSYSLRQGDVDAELPSLFGADLLFSYDYSQAKNDYSYEHPYQGKQERANNYERTYSAFASLRPHNLRNLNLQTRISNSRQGIPGAVFQESPGASASRKNAVHSAGYSTTDFDLTASYRELRQTFSDRGGFISYDKDYLQVARQLHSEYRLVPLKGIDAALGSDIVSESFFNTDNAAPQRSLPAVSRKSESAYASIRMQRSIRALSLISESRARLDRIDDDSEVSPFTSIGLSFDLPVKVGADASYSESYRIPPIDALFWRGDVFSESNPELRPENAINRELNISAAYHRSINIDLRHTWFESDVRDLITWRRQFDGKYKPVNVDQSRLSGRELTVNLATKNGLLDVGYTRQRLNAINLSQSGGYYGMVVPFKPDQTERFSLDLDLKRARLEYAYSYTGVRQIREANTKALPGYALHDFSLEIPVSVFSSQFLLKAGVYNFTNMKYELLERMPMPGRSFTVGLNINID